MSRRILRSLTAATALCLVSSSLIAQPASLASVRDSINAFYRTWSQSTMTRGPEGYASHFATDATLLPPNAPPINGRDAIRAWMERTQREATYRTVPSAISVDTLHVVGDIAIYRSTLKGQRVPLAGGDGVPFETKYFDVLQRTPGGGGEFRYRMWSDNLAPPNKM